MVPRGRSHDSALRDSSWFGSHYRFFIVNQKDSFVAHRQLLNPFGGSMVNFFPCDSREVYTERRSFARLAQHLNIPAVVFDDPVDDRSVKLQSKYGGRLDYCSSSVGQGDMSGRIHYICLHR